MTGRAPTLDAAFVAAALGDALVARHGRADATFARAAIDSRLAGPGDLFVALPGERHDGHDYARAAVSAGATGCLLGRRVIAAEEAACFEVTEPLTALQRVAVAWRDALPELTVIGITGNVGKTTTKMIAAHLLATERRVQATPLNYNNEIGVPLCLLELRPGTERAVIEMGMYTTGEIALLCRWTRPRIGVVLNVGPVHLERAGSMEAIVRAKRELVESLPADGHAVLNADDHDVRNMASHTSARTWFFGTGADGNVNLDVRGSDVESHGASGFEFTLHALGASRRVHVPLPGAHLLSNVLGAATAALADGIALDRIADAIESLAVPTRLRVVKLGGDVTLLDDTYNANPASMRAALALLHELPGRRLALLGDMRELGSERVPQHEAIGRRAAEVLDALITVGDDAAMIARAAAEAGLAAVTHSDDRASAAAALAAALQPGDVVLVKGSHALALETVVAELTRERGVTS
ncbi:MAG: UDP-N-acetylmuramoyl-tripeptide--D-alanyl-D-alanine ligase [Chloroflexi bacterium]|nr:UDP-N-acetylmuramoyl-tripeptide--D-alanyl-D-alanine ligase [Chloroflexota bacterium]